MKIRSYLISACLFIIIGAFSVAAVNNITSAVSTNKCPSCSIRDAATDKLITAKLTAKNTIASAAPGYCPSYGGSHLYEYISSLTYFQTSSETVIITVNLYIANPTGCSYGEPCPEYDDSPEYINAWIDWDGDKIWESNERVMDEALTGYININYQGTMSASNIVTIPPDAVGSTWVRVNLGWGYDPNYPCEGSWVWGDVVDKEITLEPEIKDFEVVGGLTQYGGKYKDVVFRRGDDNPRFDVTASVPADDKVKVDILRNGNTLTTLDAVLDSNKGIYVAVWDWKSAEWANIPDEIPVGEYKAKAKIVAKDGLVLVSSEEKEFYVIFDTPKYLSNAEIKAFLYDKSGIRDNNGVWFWTAEKDNLFGWDHGMDFSVIYNLHPFSEDVFDITLQQIDGKESPMQASKSIMEWVLPAPSDYCKNGQIDPLPPNKNFRYTICTSRNDVLELLSDSSNPYKFAQCADSSNLFVALLRSAGIPAHPVTVDTNQQRAGWNFDTWSEGFIDGKWYVFHPHEGRGPSERRDAGEWGWISDKDHNDLIIMAGPSWDGGNLDDDNEDVNFRYFVEVLGVPVPAPHPWDGRPLKDLDLKRGWITELSEGYWGVPHEDPPDELNQKNLTLTLSQYEYNVGDALEANITISNLNYVSITSNLSIEIISDDPFTPLSGDTILNSSKREITISPNTNYSVKERYELPYNLSSRDIYYIKAIFGNESTGVSFAVKPLYNISVAVPQNILNGTSSMVNATISNEGETSLLNITVCLSVSYNLNITDPCRKIVELLPHSNMTLSWNVTALHPDIGTLYFKAGSPGKSYVTKHINVLSIQKLDVGDEYIIFEGEFGEPFEIYFTVSNIGGLTATNVSAEITLPENVTATTTKWNIGDLIGGGNVQLSTNITFTRLEDFVINSFVYDNSSHNDSGIIYVYVPPTLSGTFTEISDYGIDLDNDSLYDYLGVNVGVNVTSAGTSVIRGGLYDSNKSKIAEAMNSAYLDIGQHLVILKFDGFAIFKHKSNGPYFVNLKLEDKEGNLLDTKNHSTSVYNYTDFQRLVALSGYYTDYGRDADDDGIFDYLTIDVGLFMEKPGHCFIKARLLDVNEEEIAWAENTTWLSGGEQVIQLNFNGTAIYNHGVNGPYYLRDVYVYHTGDPNQADYVYEAYTTSGYNYLQFRGLIEFNISLLKGWNLISFPLDLTNNSINYIFNNTNISIYGYNYSWFVPNEINNKFGYWVKVNESMNLNLIDFETEDKTINLNNGWNLIGYPYLEEKDVSELFDNDIVYSYNGNGSWLSYIPGRTFNSLQTLKPGYGYWVNVE